MELWFTEKHTPAAGITLKCRRTLFSERSKIQQIDILETEEFGRMLLLDGLVMTMQRDEFIYHEMLVHPARRKAHRRICILQVPDNAASPATLAIAGFRYNLLLRGRFQYKTKYSKSLRWIES